MTAHRNDVIDGCTSVSAPTARNLMDFAVSRGASLQLLVQRSGIDLGDLCDEEGRLPFSKYVALMNAGKELCDDPAFALHFGESDEGAERSLACMMGLMSPALAERVARLDFGENNRYEFTRDGDRLWVVDTWNSGFVEGAESAFARTVCTARHLFPGAAFVKELHFKHAEPPYRAEYDRIFGVPSVFGSHCYALILDASLLEQIPRFPTGGVHEIVQSRTEMLLQRRKSGNSTRMRVEALLTNLLHDTQLSVDVVAGKLGMSRHTLFRRLKAEGITFKEILNELRHKLAVQYLNSRKLAVNETAYLLGFSDPAAFSRAYKRWTGRSPRQVS